MSQWLSLSHWSTVTETLIARLKMHIRRIPKTSLMKLPFVTVLPQESRPLRVDLISNGYLMHLFVAVTQDLSVAGLITYRSVNLGRSICFVPVP